jgi:hypothetical protein
MFTRQLYFAKSHALAVYRQRVTVRSRQVESYWGSGDASGRFADDELRELAALNTLGTLFGHIEKMRVVPFDLRCFLQLLGSSLGSLATLLPLLHIDGETTHAFDAIAKLFEQLGG